MQLDDIIKNMASENKSGALDEKKSKELLNRFGIPAVMEYVAENSEDAVAATKKTGFPAVLKGLGETFSHKTEAGLVHLDLNTPEDVRKAALSIQKKGGADLTGFLVQSQIQGKREFMAGLFRDDQFGHVIMFGIGGVFAEALSDVSFRLAPLTKNDAFEMMDEIKGARLLGPCRGEKAVFRDQAADVLTGLSDLCQAYPDISEVDVNPLIADEDGRLTAVDALVIFQREKEKKEPPPPVDPHRIGALFYPESIAFIGASPTFGKWGNILLAYTISGGFKGDIHPVNPSAETIFGRKTYKSILDAPGKVDLAVVTIPASNVSALLPDFKKKGVKNMLLISSGFSETGEEGLRMEKALMKEAAEAGVLILGPNTMGIVNPHIDFYCAGSPVTPKAGSTAFVAQSGNMGVQLMAFAEKEGIGIRAFSGSGNEAMITIEDYLDGFEIDDLTRVVMLYIESVKNGRRFFQSARRLGKKKPVILLKGGRTKAGTKAAASHTGAMSSDAKVFDAACRQAGVVQADYSTDLLDLTAGFSSLPLPEGNRAGIMTLGGGWGVVTADLCVEHGIEIPELPPEIIKKFDAILPPYWSRSNPVDIVGEQDFSIPLTVMEELMKWDGCDAVINLGIVGRKFFIKRLTQSVALSDPLQPKNVLDSSFKLITDFEKRYIDYITELMEKYKKPIYGVSILQGETDHMVYEATGRRHKSVFYPTPERAVKTLGKMWEYKRFLSRKI